MLGHSSVNAQTWQKSWGYIQLVWLNYKKLTSSLTSAVPLQKQLQEPLASVIPAAHTEFTSLMASKQGVHIYSKSHTKYNLQPARNEKVYC